MVREGEAACRKVGRSKAQQRGYNWLKKYGVGEFTGIELTGEERGYNR